MAADEQPRLFVVARNWEDLGRFRDVVSEVRKRSPMQSASVERSADFGTNFDRRRRYRPKWFSFR